MTDSLDLTGAVCPIPLPHNEQIVLGHGSGGKMAADLIAKTFLPAFDNPALRAGDDGAVVEVPPGKLVLSTDSHVVSPLFFPGGDIGHLAVCGTVNDLAVMGATPLYLTAGFILEEGLPLDTLQRIVHSMRAAAEEAGVQIVSGDTKVVQRGKADGVYIATAGVGVLPPGRQLGGAQAQPGDVVLLSGPMGDHGIAVLAARGELGFETDIHSDCAPLNGLIARLLAACPDVHVLRDPTRGGVATTLNEIARQSGVGITLFEKNLPVRPAVAAVCEMLGFDPLYVANEGKVLVILPRQSADRALEALRASKEGREAVLIGEVTATPPGRVLMKTAIGSTRVVDMLAGELLPRIC
ncbi:MAG: hydrogenase expression/formation protein HypE [Anaerolineales bacterium]|nr:hydrogenase expression/formation protein HypE [Anaerolineales bacterium]MCX7755617.1 hydrogenase expression/formation protein HypE [Anaerolineales bacterium]MDW8276600.1 hydrogenase expression/formation protein HypE [Anaerolineales bacterium]